MRKTVKLLLLIATLFVCTVSVFSQNKQVKDPYAYIPILSKNGNVLRYCGLKGETISKSDLLKVPELLVECQGVNFTVQSFTVSARIGGYMVEHASTSSKFTEKQQNEIFAKAPKGSKIYIENIKAIGPNGTARSIGSIVVTLSDFSYARALSYAYFTYTDAEGNIQECRENCTISNAELMTVTELLIEDYFKQGLVIQSFTVNSKFGNIDYFVTPSSNNKITDEQREFFKKVTSKGARIYIENIKVVGNDGVKRHLEPFSFRIK